MHFKFIRLQIAFALFFLVSGTVLAQKGTIGLGVKAGDPTGLSIKFYQPKNPIELIIGRPYYFSGYYNDDHYYRDRFDKYDRFSNSNYKFDHYAAHSPFAIQLHWLKQQPLKMQKGLDWYLGAGPQFRAFKVDYYYRDYYGPKGNDYVIRHDQLTDYDLGIDGVIGMEYTFKDLPLSVFGDLNLFLELIDQPFMLSLQGGLGVCYNLK